MLKINTISIVNRGSIVISDFSLKVNSNEIMAIFGHNGAGKSTLLRTISGFVKHAKGSISLNDMIIDDLKIHERAELGITLIPEGGKVFPSMTVQENIELGAYRANARNKMLQNANDVFTLFPRLAERKHQKAGTLSGGEKQMLAIARGLMAEPKLLMLDEPSLGLAPIVKKQVFDALKSLRGKLSVIIVEQDVVDILQVSDRAVFIKDGRIVLEKPSYELLEDVQSVRAHMEA